MRLKPAPDRKVRDHVTRLPVPVDGIDVATIDGLPDVPADPYWQRLLRDKDVVVVVAEQAAATAPAVAPTTAAESPTTQAADPAAEHQ